MSTNRRLVPSRALTVYSLLITAIVGYAIYYAFREGDITMRIASIIVSALILLPILRIPIRIYEDNETICIKQVIGETRFFKRDYTISHVNAKNFFTIRLFATSVFLYWGYFWTKSLGKFYALCVNNSNIVLLTKKSDGSKIVIDATTA